MSIDRRVSFDMADDDKHSPLMFPVGERQLAWVGRDGSRNDVPEHKMLVRLAADGTRAEPLAVVSRNYKLVHNRELFKLVSGSMRMMFAEGQLRGAYCIDKLAHNGRTCWREYVFPCINRHIGSSQVGMRVIAQNGYGGSALKLYAGAIDFFCTNGTISGEYESYYRRHTSGVRISGLTHHLEEAMRKYAADVEQMHEWSETRVTNEATMQFFRDIASSPLLADKLSEQWMEEEREHRGSNLWSVYSTLTNYSSHTDGRFSTRSDETDSVIQQRELRVAQWVRSDAWKQLVETAA